MRVNKQNLTLMFSLLALVFSVIALLSVTQLTGKADSPQAPANYSYTYYYGCGSAEDYTEPTLVTIVPTEEPTMIDTDPKADDDTKPVVVDDDDPAPEPEPDHTSEVKERPGNGKNSKNVVHTGPPGNPDNNKTPRTKKNGK